MTAIKSNDGNSTASFQAAIKFTLGAAATGGLVVGTLPPSMMHAISPVEYQNSAVVDYVNPTNNTSLKTQGRSSTQNTSYGSFSKRTIYNDRIVKDETSKMDRDLLNTTVALSEERILRIVDNNQSALRETVLKIDSYIKGSDERLNSMSQLFRSEVKAGIYQNRASLYATIGSVIATGILIFIGVYSILPSSIATTTPAVPGVIMHYPHSMPPAAPAPQPKAAAPAPQPKPESPKS